MKLISAFHTEEAAHELRQRLEQAGIAVIVQTPVRIRNDSSPGHLVFAAIHSQHEDAVQLLKTPEHRVQTPVDSKDFSTHLLGSANRHATQKALNQAFTWILLTLLVAVAAVVFLTLN